MKRLILIPILFISFLVNATKYYISNTGGDGENGLTEITAWQTFTNVNAGSFLPDDTIALEKGGLWREMLDIPSSGTSGHPIVITSYGTGEMPILESAKYEGSWTDMTGGLYRATSFMLDNYGVFYEDSASYAMATTTDCNDGIWYNAWNGAYTYYRPTSGVPADHVINYCIYDRVSGIGYYEALSVSGRSYITIDSIKFLMAEAIRGLMTVDSYGIIIKNCVFRYCHDGVFYGQTEGNNYNLKINHSYFFRCQNGIRLYNTSIAGRDFINHDISYNEFEEIGFTDNIGTLWTYGSDMEAFGTQASQNSSFSNNYIHGGHTGITYWASPSAEMHGNIIAYNIVKDTGLRGLFFGGGEGYDGFNDNYVYYNLFVNCASGCTWMLGQGDSPTQMNYFFNNTCVGPYSNIKLGGLVDNDPMYYTFKNNIFYGATLYYFRSDNLPGYLVMDYNLYYTTASPVYFRYDGASNITFAQWQGLGYDVNGLNVNPDFTNPVSDWTIQVGSPAIDAGIGVGLNRDISGTGIKNFPDIGAYEYKYYQMMHNGKVMMIDGKRALIY